MTLQKSKYVAGMYECFGEVNGEFFVGNGQSQLEALNRCFQKVLWVNK